MISDSSSDGNCQICIFKQKLIILLNTNILDYYIMDIRQKLLAHDHSNQFQNPFNLTNMTIQKMLEQRENLDMEKADLKFDEIIIRLDNIKRRLSF